MERTGRERKGDFGTVLVVGGSDLYSGAPAFNALAALRAGADLAIVVAPRRAADIVATFAPDLITRACDAPHPRWDDVEPLAKRADALVIGGGIARTPEAHAEIARILSHTPRIPVVVDAEALRAVKPEHLRARAAILTPHPGELSAALGVREWPDDEKARQEIAREIAARMGAVVVVKGARDVIASADHATIDEEGSPYLTKGGYGDLLAGAAGAFLAQRIAPFDAARRAAALVGRAGALAARDLREATLASDALARFPDALRELAP